MTFPPIRNMFLQRCHWVVMWSGHAWQSNVTFYGRGLQTMRVRDGLFPRRL